MQISYQRLIVRILVRPAQLQEIQGIREIERQDFKVLNPNKKGRGFILPLLQLSLKTTNTGGVSLHPQTCSNLMKPENGLSPGMRLTQISNNTHYSKSGKINSAIYSIYWILKSRVILSSLTLLAVLAANLVLKLFDAMGIETSKSELFKIFTKGTKSVTVKELRKNYLSGA